jgi:hypothetical protein
MSKLPGLFEALKLYGFAIITEDRKDILDELKNLNVIHLFNVHRIRPYIVLELNTLSCEKDCDISCRDGFGVVNGDCYSECLDNCIKDKLNMITKILLSNGKYINEIT